MIWTRGYNSDTSVLRKFKEALIARDTEARLMDAYDWPGGSI